MPRTEPSPLTSNGVPVPADASYPSQLRGAAGYPPTARHALDEPTMQSLLPVGPPPRVPPPRASFPGAREQPIEHPGFAGGLPSQQRQPAAPYQGGMPGLGYTSVPQRSSSWPEPGPEWHDYVLQQSVAGVVPSAAPEVAAELPRAQTLDLFATDLFFIALDDRSGRIRIHPDVAGVTLGAALLAELVVGEQVEIDGGRLEATAEGLWRGTLPADALAHTVLETICGQSQPLTAVEWIRFLALTAEKDVADRLCRANRISIDRKRSGFGKVTRYRPADNNKAAWPRARLSEHWSAGRDMSDHDIVLTGLCHHAGLLRDILAPALSFEPGLYTRVSQESNARLATYAATGDRQRDFDIGRSMAELLHALENTVTTSTSNKLA